MLAFLSNLFYETRELKQSALLAIIFKGCLNKYIIF